MFNRNTDRDWEKLGATDPYFGVATNDKYRQEQLTEGIKADFFESGQIYINKVLANIRKHLDNNFTPKNVLDFGCGVGRLVIPLAKTSEHVTGIDVSQSMLDEARKNCESFSICNINFIKSNDMLSSLEEKYNFIHSYIVFQHIPVKRGVKIFERLVKYLDDGGVCVVHFTYAKSYRFSTLIPWIKNYVPFAKNFLSMIKGRGIFAPEMQMNTYDLNWLFSILQKLTVKNCHVQFTDHAGVLGILLYFQKPC